MDRRHFLTLLGLMSAGSMHPLRVWSAPQPVSGAEPGSPNAGRLLILIALKGGNDGLNTLIPYRDPHYRALRQRIGLARALYGDPRLVILDEPNASLDERGETALFQALADLSEAGCTVVVISHRPNMLKAVDKVLVLKHGQVEAFGPRDEILARVLKPKPLSLPGGGQRLLKSADGGTEATQ